jgi:hypothetical protein
MTDTVTNTAGLAGEVERLRELVLDLGEALSRLTAEHGGLRARVAELEAALSLADGAR